MAIRRLTIFEDEWRLLVDLVCGFNLADYDPDELQLATAGLLRMRLLEEVPNGLRVTALGHRVKIDSPPYVYGVPRVWFGPDDLGETSA